MGRRRVKTKERKRKFNDKLESSGEIKRQKGRGKIGKSVTVDVNYNREKKNIFFLEQGEEKFKQRKENIENQQMIMWLLMQLNNSVVTINATLQFLDIYRCIKKLMEHKLNLFPNILSAVLDLTSK